MAWKETLAPYLFCSFVIYYVLQQAHALQAAPRAKTFNRIKNPALAFGAALSVATMIFYLTVRLSLKTTLLETKLFMLLEDDKSYYLRFLAASAATTFLCGAVGIVIAIRQAWLHPAIIGPKSINMLQAFAIASVSASAFASIFLGLRGITLSHTAMQHVIATIEAHAILLLGAYLVFLMGPLLSLLVGVFGTLPMVDILGRQSVNEAFQIVYTYLHPAISQILPDLPVHLLISCAFINSACRYLLR